MAEFYKYIYKKKKNHTTTQHCQDCIFVLLEPQSVWSQCVSLCVPVSLWSRYAELSCWLISKESQLRLLRSRANDPSKYGQVKATITVRQTLTACCTPSSRVTTRDMMTLALILIQPLDVLDMK